MANSSASLSSSQSATNGLSNEMVETIATKCQKPVVNKVLVKMISIFMVMMQNPQASLSMILDGQKEKLAKIETEFTEEHRLLQKQIYDALPADIDRIIDIARSCSKMELPPERLAVVKKQLQEQKELLFNVQIKEELLDLVAKIRQLIATQLQTVRRA